MYKVAFVILHYENIQDTKECIDSIEKYLFDRNISIVVVDNGSVKEKAEELANQYLDDNIVFLKSKKNLGFAKGNNIGYLYAKNILRTEFIILCNNDLVFQQKDFVERMCENYKNQAFDIAGPKIISLVDGMNQNPVNRELINLSDVRKRIFKLSILLVLNFMNLDLFFQNLFAKKITEYVPTKEEDYQLHGACLILGPKYIEKFDGLYDKTFMYGEEDILRYQVEKYSLDMKYLNELIVYHKEGASTEKIYTNNKIKRRFIYKNRIHSVRLLKEMMKNKGI